MFLSIDECTSDCVSRATDTADVLPLFDEWGVRGGDRWVEFVADGVPVIVVPVAVVAVGMLIEDTPGTEEPVGVIAENKF